MTISHKVAVKEDAKQYDERVKTLLGNMTRHILQRVLKLVGIQIIWILQCHPEIISAA